jgi:RNA recognition motif-containing protein
MEVKLYVGNLSFSTTEDDLRSLFAQAGSVDSLRSFVIAIRCFRGFAFVGMGSLAEAQKAIGMFNAYKMDDRELKVNMAQATKSARRGGYGGGGYGGGGGEYGGRGGQGNRQRRGGGGQRRY